jgi:hypothetical protein
LVQQWRRETKEEKWQASYEGNRASDVVTLVVIARIFEAQVVEMKPVPRILEIAMI